MWSDNETSTDLLQFQYLASAVVNIVKTPALQPTTVGVFGDWGSGKSSLLKMVQSDLEGEVNIMCLTFSGWLFEGYEDAKTALMGTILDAIQDRILEQQSGSEKAEELIQKLQKRVNWLQLASLAGRYVAPALLGHPHLSVAMAASDVGKELYSAISEKEKSKRLSPDDLEKVVRKAPEGQENIRRNIRDFHKDFAELLTEAKIEALVVFIDDLDRCLPDTIIETLEAIKLFLFVPGTVFILGADERLIQYAVRQRFPELPGTEAEVGRDYLEKLVQIPVRIPPLNNAESHSYMNLLFAQLRASEEEYLAICSHIANFEPTSFADVTFDVEQAREFVKAPDTLAELEKDLDFTAQVVPILSPGLNGNPRRAKRFLNSLLLRLSLGESRKLRLQRQVLAKLMLLEYLKPEFFRQLAALQASQAGRPIEIKEIEHALKTCGMSVPSEEGQTGLLEQAPAPDEMPTVRGTKDQPKTDTPQLSSLPAELKTWMADGWMRSWLASEPAIADVDLRPYFYIAHDKVGSFDGLQLRLSPAASEVLNRLLDAQPVTQALGLSRSTSLSLADASALFESLSKRVRQAETLDDPQSPHKILLQLMGHRRELLPQLVALLGTLPEQKIILSIPGQLYEAANGTSSSEAARALLERWAKSQVQLLKNAARQAAARQWQGVHPLSV